MCSLQFKGLYNMGIKVTAVFTRSDTNVPFWTPSSEEYLHLIEDLSDTGKIFDATTITSADGLTKTICRTFIDQDARIAFRADLATKAAMVERDAYGTANNITVAVRSELV